VKKLLKVLQWLTIIILSTFLGVVGGAGITGGLMYLNEKLNQFGTILIGG